LSKLSDDIQTLVDEGVINESTALRISAYYAANQTDPTSRLMLAFGILASLLIGLGVILIIGHNWDTLPIIYLMPSTMVAICYFIGLTHLSPSGGGAGWHTNEAPFIPYKSLTMAALALPYLFSLCQNSPKKYTTTFLHWAAGISIFWIFLRDSFRMGQEATFELMIVFAIFYGVGYLSYFKDKKLISNPYVIIGSLGSVIILFMSSFGKFFDIGVNEADPKKITLYFLFAAALLMWNLYKKNIELKYPLHFIFLLFLPIYFVLDMRPAPMVISNILLAIVGLEYLMRGYQKNNLLFYNYGLFILCAQIVARFLEWELSFLVRGICFVILGILFFAANYHLMKKRSA